MDYVPLFGVINAVWVRFLRLFRPPIVVRPRPPTSDNHVKLLVINRDKTQDFEADVTEFAGIAGPDQEPYKMKWREHSGPAMRILAGADADLDVARITPPVLNPNGIQNSYRRGSFHLFSFRQPGGWSVSAGYRNDIMTMKEAINLPDPADEKIALKVRITGAEKISKTCRVTLGFDRPYEVDTFAPHSPVRIEVDDWPRPPSKLWARIRGLRHRLFRKSSG